MPNPPEEKGPADERLRTYRAKRSADRTPEPFGGEGGSEAGTPRPDASAPEWARPRLFCVQKHAAKQLAVEVEDHPVEYADFEGLTL